MAIDWMTMISDPNIPDAAEVTAPNGDKISMGRVREGFLARQRELEYREQQLNQSRTELANVYSMLENEKVLVEAGKEEIRNARETLKTVSRDEDESRGGLLDPAFKRLEAHEKKVAELEANLKGLHKTNVEMADIYLDDIWERAIKNYKGEVPDGITRNDVLKYAMDHSIKDRRGLPDIDGVLSKIAEPKRIEKMVKEAEDRGAARRDQELLMKSLGSPTGFQSRDSGTVSGVGKKFGDLDEAFDAAAKDASVFFPNGQVQ